MFVIFFSPIFVLIVVLLVYYSSRNSPKDTRGWLATEKKQTNYYIVWFPSRIGTCGRKNIIEGAFPSGRLVYLKIVTVSGFIFILSVKQCKDWFFFFDILPHKQSKILKKFLCQAMPRNFLTLDLTNEIFYRTKWVWVFLHARISP